MGDLEALKVCQQENDRLRKLLQQAQAFKQWSFKTLKDNNIAFVAPQTQEDYTSVELGADKKTCACPFCGQIDALTESECPMQKCSKCGHGMRRNAYGQARWNSK